MANQPFRPGSAAGTTQYERPYSPATLVASPTSTTSNYWLHSKHHNQPSMSAWSTSDTNDDSNTYSTPTSSIYHTPTSPTGKTFFTKEADILEHDHIDRSGSSPDNSDEDGMIVPSHSHQYKTQRQQTHNHNEHFLHQHDDEIDMTVVEPDEWYARFDSNHQLADNKLGDECPDRATLAAVHEIPIYDSDGQAHTFASLYDPATAVNQRQLIIFIRHFYCGACQAYLKALTESITLQDYFSIPIPTSIIVIGCGHPNLIPFYRSITGTKFPIFAEPTRQLYKKLGMLMSMNLGMRRPEYMHDISAPAWLAGQVTTIKDGLQARSEAKRLSRISSGFDLLRRHTLKPRGFDASGLRKQERDGARSADAVAGAARMNDDASQEEESSDLSALEMSARARSIRRRDVVRGGNLLQVGGEFLFEDGQVIWCHRMKHYRNHVEVSDIRKLLDLDE